MLSNWPIFILAASVFSVGAILVYFSKHNETSLTFNFGLIIMAGGTMMVGGLFVLFVLSAVLGGLSGLPVQ